MEGCVDQRQTPRPNEFTVCRRYSLRGDADTNRLRYQRSFTLINDKPLVQTNSLRVDDTCGVVTYMPAVCYTLHSIWYPT
jgi:hypothetical protein